MKRTLPKGLPVNLKQLAIGLLFVVIGFFVLLGVYLYAANQSEWKKSLKQNTPLPSVFPSSLPSPTASTDPKTTPKPSSTPVSKSPVIPSDWVKHIEYDWMWGVETTLSLPAGYTFAFTGSEWLLGAGDGKEYWDYSTSVYTTKEVETAKNWYDGSSRRVWYQKRLAEEQKNWTEKSSVVGVQEQSIGSSSYLIVSVKDGTTKKVEKHFVYVQNGIVHIIRPISEAANASDAKIPKIIDTIFFSLSSKQVKK